MRSWVREEQSQGDDGKDEGNEATRGTQTRATEGNILRDCGVLVSHRFLCAMCWNGGSSNNIATTNDNNSSNNNNDSNSSDGNVN